MIPGLLKEKLQIYKLKTLENYLKYKHQFKQKQNQFKLKKLIKK
jgi:hypothetical protein